MAGFLLLTLVLAAGLTRLELDESMEASYPDHAPALVAYEQVAETFGTGHLLVAVLEGEVYTPARLELLRELTLGLERSPGVQRVMSAGNAQRPSGKGMFVRPEPLVPEAGVRPEEVAEIRAFLEDDGAYGRGLLVSPAGDRATVLLQVGDDLAPDALLAGVEAALAAWPGDVHLAGAPVVDVALKSTMKRDLPLMNALSGLLILVFLYLNFRTRRGALLPLVTVGVGLTWAMGALAWSGGRLSTMGIIGPVAVLAVGSSFALHLLGRYYHELAHGASQRDALRRTVARTGVGVLISGLAISAAMLTFLLSAIPSVRLLGLLTAGGVLASLTAALVLLPALLTLLPPPKRLPDPEAAGPLAGLLGGLARFVTDRRRALLGLAGLVALASAGGIARIHTDTAILSYFKEDSGVRRAFRVVEEAFGGSAQTQVLVRGDLTDPAALEAMLAFQERAAEIDGVGEGSSVATVVAAVTGMLGGEPGIPGDARRVERALDLYAQADAAALSEFVTEDRREGLINLPIHSTSTRELRRMQAEVEGLAAEHLRPHLETTFTGMSLLQLAIEDALRHDFVLSLTLAIVLVVIVDSFLRSVRAAVVTISALLLTIAVQYGVLGYLGVPLDLATMLLGALAVGVGDYAIHLTVRYMENLERGDAPEAAMRGAMLTSGRSILFTALTLGAGFAAMLVSDFVPIRTLGALMTFTVVMVGITSLTLLPAACLVFLRALPARRTRAAAPSPT